MVQTSAGTVVGTTCGRLGVSDGCVELADWVDAGRATSKKEGGVDPTNGGIEQDVDERLVVVDTGSRMELGAARLALVILPRPGTGGSGKTEPCHHHHNYQKVHPERVAACRHGRQSMELPGGETGRKSEAMGYGMIDL